MPRLPLVSNKALTAEALLSRMSNLPAPWPLPLAVEIRFQVLPPVSVLPRLNQLPMVLELKAPSTALDDVEISSLLKGDVVPIPASPVGSNVKKGLLAPDPWKRI